MTPYGNLCLRSPADRNRPHRSPHGGAIVAVAVQLTPGTPERSETDQAPSSRPVRGSPRVTTKSRRPQRVYVYPLPPASAFPRQRNAASQSLSLLSLVTPR